MKTLFLMLTLLMTPHSLSASGPSPEARRTRLTFLHTSDVHASLFSYDFLQGTVTRQGLSSLYAYVRSLRSEEGRHLVLTDGGDCLQGQPTAYYYNNVDTLSPHLVARVMNDLHYDCVTLGNHDLETGHAVYDRWISQLNAPVLGANVLDIRTGEPYLTPYIITEREGLRIALLGMVTPTISSWLPQVLWSGMRFEDILTSCRKWVSHLREKEHPDLIVGVFHSGFHQGIRAAEGEENAVEEVARKVPGFDFILYGHDHRPAIHKVSCQNGVEVTCAAPGSDGASLVQVDVEVTCDAAQHVRDKRIKARLVDASPYAQSLDAEFLEADYVEERQALQQWVGQRVGTLTADMDELDAFFGPSLFMDFIHQMQLELTGADISFCAPLSFNTFLKAGPLLVSDMFRLYKYENFLYTMRLTGREVKDYLEMSYAQWTHQMQSAESPFLRMAVKRGKVTFEHPTFNFDSAAGIRYTVDVTQPEGNRVCILSMADGTPFLPEREYRVAVNSYRGNGGGELLTKGAGIASDELQGRILHSTGTDLRLLLMQHIQRQDTITPQLLDCWKFVPEDWVRTAREREKKRLMN